MRGIDHIVAFCTLAAAATGPQHEVIAATGPQQEVVAATQQEVIAATGPQQVVLSHDGEQQEIVTVQGAGNSDELLLPSPCKDHHAGFTWDCSCSIKTRDYEDTQFFSQCHQDGGNLFGREPIQFDDTVDDGHVSGKQWGVAVYSVHKRSGLHVTWDLCGGQNNTCKCTCFKSGALRFEGSGMKPQRSLGDHERYTGDAYTTRCLGVCGPHCNAAAAGISPMWTSEEYGVQRVRHFDDHAEQRAARYPVLVVHDACQAYIGSCDSSSPSLAEDGVDNQCADEAGQATWLMVVNAGQICDTSFGGGSVGAECELNDVNRPIRNRLLQKPAPDRPVGANCSAGGRDQPGLCASLACIGGKCEPPLPWIDGTACNPAGIGFLGAAALGDHYKCRAGHCGFPGYCGHCEFDTHCEKNADRDATNCILGRCQRKRGLTELCALHSDCASGWCSRLASGWTCQARKADGEPCLLGDNDECQSGRCNCCFWREPGQRLPRFDGSRCRPKGNTSNMATRITMRLRTWLSHSIRRSFGRHERAV